MVLNFNVFQFLYFFVFIIYVFNFSALDNFRTGNVSEILNNTLFMDPLSEILLATGVTLFITSLVYCQLPIDLIPDCIPCIGKYDNFLAKIIGFFGLVSVVIAVYLQLYFCQSPNTVLLYFIDWIVC